MRRETGEGDAGLDSPVGVEHRLAQPIEGKAAAALPTQSLRNPALLAVHHLVQARRAMGHGVLAHLDPDPAPPHLVRHRRSEAHTSELQSLMRISYAVFCLKKKTKT